MTANNTTPRVDVFEIVTDVLLTDFEHENDKVSFKIKKGKTVVAA